ncbi:MAG: type II toxin-antitoxin system HicA family toxin [Candidatus Nealsonbacteria bacterium]
MKKLPSLKSKDVIFVLLKLGFRKDRSRGSHLILYNPLNQKRAVVPVHKGKDIKKSLLKKIIEEDIGITIEEFLKILRK